MKFIAWVIAWSVMILLIYVLSKTRAGNVIIYYAAWLLVFFMIVSNYKQIISILTGGGL